MRNKKEQKSEQDVMLKDWTNLASKTLDNEELATINGGDGCCWWNPLTWFSVEAFQKR